MLLYKLEMTRNSSLVGKPSAVAGNPKNELELFWQQTMKPEPLG